MNIAMDKDMIDYSDSDYEHQPIHDWLVVSIPLKNMKVSRDDYSQYMEK